MRNRLALLWIVLLALGAAAIAAPDDRPVVELSGGTTRLVAPSKDGGLPEMYREIPRITPRSAWQDGVTPPPRVKPGTTEMTSYVGSEAAVGALAPRGGSAAIAPAVEAGRKIRAAIRKLG